MERVQICLPSPFTARSPKAPAARPFLGPGQTLELEIRRFEFALPRRHLLFCESLGRTARRARRHADRTFLSRHLFRLLRGPYESFREAEPPWAATLAVAVGLPFANHSIEFLVHWMRGTRKLVPSILFSLGFTLLSTLFNFYAMRRGALVVGEGRRSLAQDLRSMPRLLLEFVLLVPRSIRRAAESVARFPDRSASSPVCPKD
jgi:hypothetical protein